MSRSVLRLEAELAVKTLDQRVFVRGYHDLAVLKRYLDDTFDHLIAGIVPRILLGLLFIAYIIAVGIFRPDMIPPPKTGGGRAGARNSQG